MDCYRTWDYAEAGYTSWPFVLCGMGAIALGLLASYALRKSPPTRRWAMLGVAIIWTALVGIGTLGTYIARVRDLRTGNYQVVEGMISQYSAVPAGVKGDDKFEVNGQRFEIVESDMAPGFKLTERRGGPLHAGLYVRIAYMDGTMLRIETCFPH